MQRNSSPVFRFLSRDSRLDTLLPPGFLPHGLRRLQLPVWCISFRKVDKSPLQVSSIPSTVELLQG